MEAEHKDRLDIQKQILEEYKKHRKSCEEYMMNMQKQITIANQLRAEKNDLLKKLLRE